MICPKCGATNEDNAKFCRDCGETFIQSTQGAPVPPQADQQPPVQPQQPPVQPYQQPMQGGAYYQQQMPPQGPRPTFNTTPVICAIIFGFLCGGWIGGVLGILSLLKGNKVDSLYAMGDYQGADSALRESKKFLKLSWILSAVGFVLMFVYGIITGLASALV